MNLLKLCRVKSQINHQGNSGFRPHSKEGISKNIVFATLRNHTHRLAFLGVIQENTLR